MLDKYIICYKDNIFLLLSDNFFDWIKKTELISL